MLQSRCCGASAVLFWWHNTFGTSHLAPCEMFSPVQPGSEAAAAEGGTHPSLCHAMLKGVCCVGQHQEEGKVGEIPALTEDLLWAKQWNFLLPSAFSASWHLALAILWVRPRVFAPGASSRGARQVWFFLLCGTLLFPFLFNLGKNRLKESRLLLAECAPICILRGGCLQTIWQFPFYFLFYLNIRYYQVMFFTAQIPFQTGKKAAPLVSVRHFAAERHVISGIFSLVGTSVSGQFGHEFQ